MLKRYVVVNTSPLLYLHQISQLELLYRLYEIIHVPTAVVQELEAGKSKGIDVPSLMNISWVEVVSLPLSNLAPNENDLGKGEAEVITIGLTKPNSLLTLDDQLGR
jgi:hypothetical protein